MAVTGSGTEADPYTGVTDKGLKEYDVSISDNRTIWITFDSKVRIRWEGDSWYYYGTTNDSVQITDLEADTGNGGMHTSLTIATGQSSTTCEILIGRSNNDLAVRYSIQPVDSTPIRVKIGGQWQKGRVYVKINGQWSQAHLRIRTGGQWR